MIAVLLHTTFCRFEHVKRTIDSFKMKPEFKLYISDTGEQTLQKLEYYKEIEGLGHKYYHLGWDTTPATTRNFLIDQIKEEYILKMDDDFDYIPEEVQINNVLNFMKKRPNAVLMGFGVYSKRYESEFVFDLEIKEDDMYRRQASGPVDMIGGLKVQKVDVTPDIWLARRNAFPDLNWDERYHVAEGLHTDFFANIKFNTNYDVYFMPENRFYTFKHEPEWRRWIGSKPKSFYNTRRFRNLGEKRQPNLTKFCEKWGVNNLIKC